MLKVTHPVVNYRPRMSHPVDGQPRRMQRAGHQPVEVHPGFVAAEAQARLAIGVGSETTALQRRAARIGGGPVHDVYAKHLAAYAAWKPDLRRERRIFKFAEEDGFMEGMVARIREGNLSKEESQLALEVLQYGDPRKFGRNLSAEDCLYLWDMELLAVKNGALPLNRFSMASLRRYFSKLDESRIPQNERDELLLDKFWNCMSIEDRDLRAQLLVEFFKGPFEADLKRLLGLSEWKTGNHMDFDQRRVVVLKKDGQGLILDDARDGQLYFVSEDDHVATYPHKNDQHEGKDDIEEEWYLASQQRLARYAGLGFKLYHAHGNYVVAVPLDAYRKRARLGVETAAGNEALVMVQRERDPVIETLRWNEDVLITMSSLEVGPDDYLRINPKLLNFGLEEGTELSSEPLTVASIDFELLPQVSGAQYRYLVQANDGRYAYIRVAADQLQAESDLNGDILVSGQPPSVEQLSRVLQSLPFILVSKLPSPLDISKLPNQGSQQTWSDERLRDSLIQFAVTNSFSWYQDGAQYVLMAALKDDFVPESFEGVPQPFEKDLPKFWADANATYFRSPSEFAKRFPSVAFILQSYWAAQASRTSGSALFVVSGGVLNGEGE